MLRWETRNWHRRVGPSSSKGFIQRVAISVFIVADIRGALSISVLSPRKPAESVVGSRRSRPGGGINPRSFICMRRPLGLP